MIRWGIIGCGGIAYRRAIPGLMLSKNRELVAVMDTNFEMAEKVKDEFGAKYAFKNAEDLLSLDEIDAVYIATPVFCHKELAFMAAKAKKHILLEKPLGLSSDEAKEIYKVCLENDVKLSAGLMMRYSSYHQKIKELISGGVIGQVVSMRAQLTCWHPEIEGVWRQDKAKSGGGALMDMGIHCIDFLQYMSGTKAAAVSCFAQNQTFNYSVEDSSGLLMKMNNGAVCYVDSNFNIPDEAAKCRLEFYGTKGSILCEGTISQTESGTIELTSSDDVGGYNANQNRTITASKKVEVVTGNMYEKEFSAFADAILNDTQPPITAEEAIFLQEIIEKAYLSSKTGRCVNI